MVNLLSDFGGNIGLWIGFSIITMMEIVELVCEMCYYLVYRRPMQMTRRKQQRDKVLVRRQFRFRTNSSSLLSTAVGRSIIAESSLEFEDIDHNMPQYHRIHHSIYRNMP